MQPDTTTMREHLELIFEPVRPLFARGLLELRYGQHFASTYFAISKAGLDEAVHFVAARNAAGDNVYFGPNPRRADLDRRRAATDKDVPMAIWHFADLDDPEAVRLAGSRLRALPPLLTVNTGTVPSRRPHFYWLLDEPMGNLSAWTERQSAIADKLEGDRVINPSRIMRLAGTINYPDTKKIARGYTVELTSLRTQWRDERGPVSTEEIAAAFPTMARQTKAIEQSSSSNPFSTFGRTAIADLMAEIRAGREWHNNMIRLVAHLAAIGRSNAEIMALADHLTLDGYSVESTRYELEIALQSARSKWSLPEPIEAVIEHEEAERLEGTFQTFDFEQMEALPPPTWLIDNMISEDGLSIIYGPPGAGKSFIALDMALHSAHGKNWAGLETKRQAVLYIAGEGVRGLAQRIRGWRVAHGVLNDSAPFWLLPQAVELLDQHQRLTLVRTIEELERQHNIKFGLIIVDTVSRAMPGVDENTQDTMSAFVKACDDIKRRCGGALIGLHHAGKDRDRGMRGSSVLLGACDASIRVQKDGDIVTLSTEKQKDGEEAQPLYFELKPIIWGQGIAEQRSTLVPVLRKLDDVPKISRDQIRQAIALTADAWIAHRPLSNRPQTQKDGRFAPAVFASKIGGSREEWSGLLNGWLENGVVAVSTVNAKTKERGLEVIDGAF